MRRRTAAVSSVLLSVMPGILSQFLRQPAHLQRQHVQPLEARHQPLPFALRRCRYAAGVDAGLVDVAGNHAIAGECYIIADALMADETGGAAEHAALAETRAPREPAEGRDHRMITYF